LSEKSSGMLSVPDSLSRLKEEVNDLLPECAIHVGFDPRSWDEVDISDIERLRAHLSVNYPEAGARYWRARGWGLLIWQPIYLAVIAAHKCQMLLPLGEMSQDIPLSGIPSGVLFRGSQFKHGQVDDCVQQMAEELVTGCRKVYIYWQLSGLPRKVADRIVADCVLSALLMVYPAQPVIAEELGDLWLQSMGLRGAAGFIPYKNMLGERRLALDKKNCCFRYLCHGRAACDVCPRQTMAERLKRLRQVSAQISDADAAPRSDLCASR
jgi:siderophore ferric iron reductase